MRGVDGAPARVDLGMVEQPAHRPRPDRDAVLDLLDLLGDMHVDRAIAGKLDDRRQFLRRTARNECGATPTSSAASARTPRTSRAKPSRSVMNRRCSGRGGAPPKVAWA